MWHISLAKCCTVLDLDEAPNSHIAHHRNFVVKIASFYLYFTITKTNKSTSFDKLVCHSELVCRDSSESFPTFQPKKKNIYHLFSQ